MYDEALLIEELCPSDRRFNKLVEFNKKRILVLKISSDFTDEIMELIKDEAFNIASENFDAKHFLTLTAFKAETDSSKNRFCEDTYAQGLALIESKLKIGLDALNIEQKAEYDEIYPPKKRKTAF